MALDRSEEVAALVKGGQARRRYRVELPHVPAMVIGDCSSAEEAFSRYLAANGIIASDHRPEIAEVDDEVVVHGSAEDV
jgi:hypothetical protein